MYKAKQAYTGDIASRYDEDRMNEPLWDLEQAIVRAWVADLPKGAVVLDVPVGTGRFLPFYRESRLRLRGLDVSPDMVGEAQRRHGPLPPHIVLSVGDAENLPLPDKSVDFVICWRLAHLLPLPVLRCVLMEFRRVSRREVLLQVLAMAPEAVPQRPRWRVLLRPFRKLYRRLTNRVGKPWAHITSYAHKESEIVSLAAELGFVVVGRIDLGVYGGQASAAFRLRVA